MTTLDRPTWVTDDWRDDQPTVTTTLYSVVWPKSAIVMVIALAVTLLATLALAIYATLDMERSNADLWTRWQLAEARVDGLAEQNTMLTAERDLANEAWSQCSGLPLGPGA